MRNKKINKVKVGIVCAVVIVFVMNLTGFGRYVYNNIKDSYLTSQQFYFTSDLLDVNKETNTYNNWSGTDLYKLDIELYSLENELLKVDYDMEYNISCTISSSQIECKIGSPDTGSSTAEGVISKNTNQDVASIYLCPKDGADFSLGETVILSVTAYTTEPYRKTLSGDFIFEITAQGADYQIEDKENQTYALIKLKNSLAIDSNVTLRFNPNVVRLDMNDEAYLNNVNYKTQQIGGQKYVNEITFFMTKESSKNIKFYKIDKTQDYTNQLNIIEVIKTEVGT